MKSEVISVTEAARNFSDCLNRVHYQNMSFLLLKNGKPFARLVPESEKVCAGHALAQVLAETPLPAEEARAWHDEVVEARANLSVRDKGQ